MKKKTPISKKRRGPAPTGVGKPQLVRMHDDQLATLDAWITEQKEPDLTRPEAIRRLVELGLVASVPTSKAATKLAWRKKTIERWAERLADLGWRQRLDNLLRAAMRGSMQPQLFEGLPIQGGLRGEDYVKQEALELFGIRWKAKK